MAVNFSLGGAGFDNEYMSQAEAAGREAERRKQAAVAGGAAGSPIATVLDLLGIGRQVAKAPKGESKDTGDLASTPPEGETVTQIPVTSKKGDVIAVVEDVTKDPESKTQRLPMAPLQLSGQGIPRPLTSIDPDLGF